MFCFLWAWFLFLASVGEPTGNKTGPWWLGETGKTINFRQNSWNQAKQLKPDKKKLDARQNTIFFVWVSVTNFGWRFIGKKTNNICYLITPTPCIIWHRKEYGCSDIKDDPAIIKQALLVFAAIHVNAPNISAIFKRQFQKFWKASKDS